MTGTLNVTSEHRSVVDMHFLQSLKQKPAKSSPRYCESCMSEAAKSSLDFLRKKIEPAKLPSKQGICSRCVEHGQTYDVPFLLLLSWYGLLDGNDISTLLDKCQSASFFDRAIEFNKSRVVS